MTFAWVFPWLGPWLRFCAFFTAAILPLRQSVTWLGVKPHPAAHFARQALLLSKFRYIPEGFAGFSGARAMGADLTFTARIGPQPGPALDWPELARIAAPRS